MGFLDSIGTLFEGGLFARALEPKAGDPPTEESFEGACLNCGTVRVGPHCHRCGQPAHLHKSMRGFVHDLLHGALHWEGKTWRTLPLLAWRPGQLTRRYIDGERARFVSPMALFLFSVFLMFAVFQLAGITPPSDFGPAVQLDPGDRVILAENEAGTMRPTGEYTGVGFIDHGIEKWRENPGLMAYKLQSNGYKFSWLLIPLSLPFLWLLFLWRRRFGMYDHAVFVTYSLSFMTLFYVALVLLSAIGVAGGVLALLFVFVPLLHIYKQLKGTYELRRFSALWRTAVLVAFILAIVVLFVNLLLVIGAVG